MLVPVSLSFGAEITWDKISDSLAWSGVLSGGMTLGVGLGLPYSIHTQKEGNTHTCIHVYAHAWHAYMAMHFNSLRAQEVHIARLYV